MSDRLSQQKFKRSNWPAWTNRITGGIVTLFYGRNEMTNTVQNWMSRPVLVVDPDTTVSYALTLMRRRRVHSLVVNITDDKLTYGIITSTDIRDKIIAEGRNPAETRVREIMTAPVITARPDWTLQECSQKMQKHNIHHLPVCSEDGELIGIISATDIFIAAEEIGWGQGS
jgi:isocitrate dehydrogenase